MALALRAALAFVFTALLAAAPASAEPGFEYGEVGRFGGFDSSAYNGGQYGGAPTPGTFLDPTGFAVDPVDNTVYVVDRTSKYAHNPTAWRIQQLSPEGAALGRAKVLGTTTFTLPNGNFGRNSAIEGLAVDHRAGRLYALVVGSPPAGSQNSLIPVAQELLAWSTTPNAQAELEAAPGLANDPLQSTGALLSSARQLLSGASPLYAPQGIAVDPVQAPGVENPIVIEASDYGGTGAGSPPGDTLVQQVATQAHGASAAGDLLASWSGASVAGAFGASWGPLGISTAPDGTLTVLLQASRQVETDAYVIKLKADLSEAAALNSDANAPPGGDSDQVPLWIDPSPFVSVAGVGVSDLSGAGPEIIHLSTAAGGEGPYVGDVYSQGANQVGQLGDYQYSPTAPGPVYWVSGVFTNNYESNIGVRLLQPKADGTISDARGTTIVNTLGNAEVGQPCNIGAPAAALAAGAAGTLWILDRGPRADSPEARGQGREVIELAPGASRLCPQPAGTFTMSAAGRPQSVSGEKTLEVPAGTQVTFDASTIDRKNGKPFAYEWDIDGNASNGPRRDGFEKVYEMSPPSYFFPPSSITNMYTRPGSYTVRVRLRSDYGVYTPEHAGTVIVKPALIHPEARFTATPSGGQQVTFNAAGSAPGVGTITNYHWNWGDGGEEDEGPQTTVVTHAYAQPGSYPVMLTVTNSSYQSATSAPQTVRIAASAHPAQTPSPLTGPLYAIPPLALYPIPAAAADRTPTRLHPRARFAGGALRVTLACPASKALCAGAIDVETAAALTAKSAPARRHKARRLLLGSARFSIPGGHSATLTVRLSAPGMALLRRAGRLNVLVLVAAHDSLGDPGTATLRFTLLARVAPAQRSHRTHRR